MPSVRDDVGVAFLDAGGEMGALIRNHDWSSNPLGPPQNWSQALKTSVRMMLNTGLPMYIYWGPDSRCLYNDAYAKTLGAERHPSSLGLPAREVWLEIWDQIAPQIEQVLEGRGVTWHENQYFETTCNGEIRKAWWTYSMVPIDDEGAESGIGGVFVACAETTRQVVLAQQLAKSEERLNLALSAGGGIGTWDWDIVNDRLVADDRVASLYSLDAAVAREGAPLHKFFTAILADDLPGLKAKIDEAMQRPGPFRAEYRVRNAEGSIRWLNAEGLCEFDAAGQPVRFVGVSFDVTELTTYRRSLESMVSQRTNELQLAIAELEASRDEAQQATVRRALSWPT